MAAAATFQASATRVLFLIDAAGFLGMAALGGITMRGHAEEAVIFQGVPQSEQGRAWSAFGILAGSCALLGYLTGAALGAEYARETMLVSGALPAGVGVLALLVELEP